MGWRTEYIEEDERVSVRNGKCRCGALFLDCYYGEYAVDDGILGVTVYTLDGWIYESDIYILSVVMHYDNVREQE